MDFSLISQAFAQVPDANQVIAHHVAGWLCTHQQLVEYLLASFGIANIVSWFDKFMAKLPPPLQHIVSLVAGNWDDLLDAYLVWQAANNQPTKPTSKKK